MNNIKIRNGKKSKKDKIVSVNGIDISYNDFSKEVQRLCKEHGSDTVRKKLDIPQFKHRDKKLPELSLEEAKELANIFYDLEDTNYPPSEGKEGRKMLQKKLSRDLFRNKIDQ